MRTYIHSLFGIALFFLLACVSQVSAQVPNYYYQNYQIADDFNEMTDTLTTLEAALKVGEEPDITLFERLSENFDVVFEFFPKTSFNTQVYKQCELITARLSNGYSISDYTTFKDKCFDDLRAIVKDVEVNNTVKAKISAKPVQGSAPHSVTLNASASIDPSQDTIPSDQYFWYYKDIDGVATPIGTGPVINHIFDEAGTYVVHLVIRSVNNQERGVFDGSDTARITVAPKSANMIVYLNGKLLDTQKIMKIGTQEAQGGFSIDGTATSPIGARTIVEHTRRISGDQQQSSKYKFEQTREGSPGQFNAAFPSNGVYKVELIVIDNENNRLTESYQVSVSDPVALIRFSPESGNTQTEYTFDASASYSLTSRVQKYQWVITDPEGRQIESFESRDLQRRFALPGQYTIKLTVTDDTGSASIDVQKFYVDSTEPSPIFVAEPISERDKPSQFVLDASGTQDVDVTNGVDSLTYQRTFSQPDAVEVATSETGGKKILVTFNEIGKHTVQLTVRDRFGKIADVKKDIVIESTLRPELLISPVTAVRGEEISVAAKANKPVGLYTRDFGDRTSQTTKAPGSEYTYGEAGIYDVSLHVVTPNGDEENTITRRVFMGQKDVPVVAYEVKRGSAEYLQEDERCEVDGVDMPAFKVDRFEQVMVSIAESISVEGDKSGLNHYIQLNPLDDSTIVQKSTVNHGFDELGCFPLDVTVEDPDVGKSATQRIWFNVYNALPTIDNIHVTFPQINVDQGMGIGVGLQAPKETTDLFAISKLDPLLVRVTASGVRDPDSSLVSRFIRYYYNTKSPDDYIDVKVTPASIAYATFSLPRIPGEYSFGVKVIDGDDGEIDSTETLGKGPVVFFPPSDTNPDVPLVTLTTTTRSATVGEEVTFTAFASILSNRSDFVSERYFEYDVDGDGNYDTGPVKGDTYTHIYGTSGTYKPKVKVVYRERSGVARSNQIIVKQGVKPQFLSDIFGTQVLIKNTTIGDVSEQILCADVDRCAEGSEYRIADPKTHLVDYGEPGVYDTKLISVDAYGNKPAPYNPQLTLTDTNEVFGLMSIPQAVSVGSGFDITVGSLLNNEINMYLSFAGEGNCYADLDVTVDADRDGDTLYDADVPCNELVTQQFSSTKTQQNGRIYYAIDGELTTIPLTIQFLDAQESVIEIAPQYQEVYDRLTTLIAGANDPDVYDPDAYYEALLLNLRDSLDEKDQRGSLLLQLRDILKNGAVSLPEEDQLEIDLIVLGLTDENLQSALGGSSYDQAKGEVLAYFSGGVNRTELLHLFEDFESKSGNKEEMKVALDAIYTRIDTHAQDGLIDEIDLNFVKKALCEMVYYYELSSQSCGTSATDPGLDDEPNEDTDEKDKNTDSSGGSSSGGMSGLVKGILIAIGVIVLGLIVMIVLFALRAKKRQEEETE